MHHHKLLILFALLIFAFSIAMVPATAPYWGVAELTYALLSLSVLRMIPVAISISVFAHGISATPFSRRYGDSRPSLDR